MPVNESFSLAWIFDFDVFLDNRDKITRFDRMVFSLASGKTHSYPDGG